MKSTLFSIFFALLLFTGCSKEVNEYNKPAAYWYGKIVESISKGDVGSADDYYASLQGEHIGSPLLPEATMILAIGHMHAKEYLLTEHFLNEYIKRYANENEREFAEFLKIKAKYMSLPNPRRDQVFISEVIRDAKAFLQQYPHSSYCSLVENMLTNLYLARALLNETIASLYERIDKPKAAAYYRAKISQKWIDYKKVQRPKTPWYKAIFEGDGSSSWYAFLIPDTKSVVSRNSVSDDENQTKKQ